MGRIQAQDIEVEGRSARVFTGGDGEPVLLIHGGWGGAEMHWAPVWEELAAKFRVIAPDLPGIGRTDQPGLGAFGDYARWLGALLTALQVDAAWCVGNSFGASVACRFATDAPERCLGLILVNGIPLPPTPPALRWLGERALGRRVLRRLLKVAAWNPGALPRAFADPRRAPRALEELLRQPAPPQLDTFVRMLTGGSPTSQAQAPLLIWGEDDRLPGSDAAAAKKLQASWPGAKLAFVKGAGHMPQLENPGAFTSALASFIRARTPSAAGL